MEVKTTGFAFLSCEEDELDDGLCVVLMFVEVLT